jgi:hypothetical protein
MHPIRAEGRMPSAGRVDALTEVGVTGGEIAQSAPTTEGRAAAQVFGTYSAFKPALHLIRVALAPGLRDGLGDIQP